MVEEIPDNYPESCRIRAALANFDMSVFTEDSNKKMEDKDKSLAEKLTHEGCLKDSFDEGNDSDNGDNKKKRIDIFKPISNVTIVKEPSMTNKESAGEKNRSILAPKMLGLFSPDQNLNQLSEFERLSSKSQYEQAKKQQTNLHDKLMHFISYLVMVQT
jgi:hypothetical protein